MRKPYPQPPPIAHHFEVESDRPLDTRRDIQQKAEWIRRELATSLHDDSIRVRVVFE